MVQKKCENFLNGKNVKITKQEHASTGYASTFNVKNSNSFNHEIQVKNIESTIKSKLIELLTHLKGFKFVTTLVLMFNDIESKDKIKYYNIYSSSKAGEIISKSHIDDVFDYIYTTIIKNIQRS